MSGQAERDEAGRLAENAAAPDGNIDALLDEMPVQLVFEAGRTELTLGELRELGVGSVLAIPGALGIVDIRANGRRIGSGALVSVEGRPAVRIDSFAADVDRSATPTSTSPRRGADT